MCRSTGAAPNPLATDTLWAAKGDLSVGTANDAAAVLSVGTFGQTQVADSSTSTGLIYANPVDLSARYLKVAGSYETFSRASAGANTAALTSGTVTLAAIVLPKNFLVTNLSVLSVTTAAVAPTHWWFSLCDNTYTTLRSTADQTTTAWGATTLMTKALSSTFTTTYEGLYYVAVMVRGHCHPSREQA